jgi:hypothetical protein
MQAHDPWKVLWSVPVEVRGDWRDSSLTFAPSETDEDARLTFSDLGTREGAIWLSDVSLRLGGVLGLRKGEGEGRIGVFAKKEFSSRTVEAQRDWIRFLWEVEEGYWTGLNRFLKDDLKVKALVLGMQMGWSPSPIQARLDVIDSHAYWQHPVFPGRGWDEVNWRVANVPMAGVPDGGTLPRLALSRVEGKPFICTEYNHSAPNTYSSEAFLLLSAFAAMQDWDGIFAFAYSHRRDAWDPRKIPNFFDIDQHPAKMATLPAAAAMFLRVDVPPGPRHATAAPTMSQAIDQVRRAGPYLGADAFGVARKDALQFPVGIAWDGPSAARPDEETASRPPFRWGDSQGRRVAIVDTPRSKAVVGSVGTGRFALDGAGLAFGPTRQGWAAVTLTAMDGDNLSTRGRILVTATGYAENTDMGWKDADRTTVGRDWGRAPSLVEGVLARISLPVAPSRIRAHALDEKGQRRREVTVRGGEGEAVIEVGPEYRTLWYEIEIQP